MVHTSLVYLAAEALGQALTAPPPVGHHLMPASRMDKIKNMYAFEGFLYALNNCPSQQDMISDFQRMKAKGARNVITFDLCGDGKDANFYGDVIGAAGTADLNVMPLVWTLLNDGQNFDDDVVPRIDAVTQAVINNPDPVLAVAMGDEPLYDDDFENPDNLAKYIKRMKKAFSGAGLSDIPISISDMAYGWQNPSGDISNLVDTVDFFMINNFPYFAWDAEDGGSDTSWNSFIGDINYFEGIANGKPLLVTQTGWPENRNEFAPNSPKVVVSLEAEKGYWNLLDSHCEDFFKDKNIGWMWRSWDDSVDGWGVTKDGKDKWNFSARKTC